MKVSRLWKRGGRVRAKGITILKFEGKTDCFPNEREPTTWELLRGERRFSNIYGKRSVNETEPWQTEPEGYRVPFQNLPFPLSRYAIVPARCETLPVESRYSIDHNARRKKEREIERRISRRRSLYFTKRISRREKVHGCPVARISLLSFSLPSLSLSLRSFVHLTLLSRAFFSYAPSSTYVGGLDGWSLFVFRYAKLRPGISRGLGKLRSPSATTDRKQDGHLKKKKRKKEERKKGERVFILRTHGDYVRSTGEGGC